MVFYVRPPAIRWSRHVARRKFELHTPALEDLGMEKKWMKLLEDDRLRLLSSERVEISS